MILGIGIGIWAFIIYIASPLVRILVPVRTSLGEILAEISI
ncbi:hypothetical protein [Faecalispora jeddahensis]|nr:hypothetical protein [Faecalispora jeddahensis]